MTTKSAYNFIPAPEKVYFPKWAEEISHDIPFEDGESGEIVLKITAQTPLFIRNGHSKENPTNQFSHFENGDKSKSYFIPATSLKGMIRNVVEIISFSRLNPDLVDNNRYSYRDLRPKSEYLNNYNSDNVKAGWLKQDEEKKWTITECKQLIKIHHSDVDKLLDDHYKNNFKGFKEAFLNKNPEDRTAKWKYDQVNDLDSLDVTHLNVKGRLVFTGQSSRRNDEKKSGKVHEFLFSNETIEDIEVPPKMQKDFRFIYNEYDSNNISTDWEMWKEKLDKGDKVPVFFTKEGNELKHFGLAFMYKLPYEKSIHQLSPINSYTDSKIDLATAIFGHTDDAALKGRVYFGHAVSDNATPFSNDEVKKEILASPKASFYPFYLIGGNYNSPDSKLGGFKRYPVHKSKSIITVEYSQKQKENTKVFSEFIPLKAGAEFYTKLRFHNLKKVEIGALLSALTFHENSDTYSHTIGGVKPYGYGKVKIEVSEIKYLKHKLSEYLLEFESLMDDHLRTEKWVGNEAICKLFAMSKTEVSDHHNEQYEYPKMNQEKNEFKSEVNLPSYDDPSINSLTAKVQADLEAEINQKFTQLENSENLTDLQGFIEQYPNSIHVEKIRRKIDEIEKFKEYNELLQSEDIAQLREFLTRSINEEYRKNITERITGLQQAANKAKAEKIQDSPLNIEENTYTSILARMREFSNLRVEYTIAQRKELIKAIIESFSDEESAKEYSRGFNRKPNRLKHAWREFNRNGLTMEEITELNTKFQEKNG